MNHCESLSHQLRDARREVAAKNQSKGKCPEEKATGERRPTVQTDDERVREWSEEPPSLCQSACLLENAGKGEHQVRVTFDRSSFNTSKTKKKQDVAVEKKTSTASSRQCLVLRRGRWFNYEFIPQKKYGFRERFIDFIASVRLKIAVTRKNIVCNKCQISSPREISYLSTISNVPSISNVFHFLLHKSSTDYE